MSEIDKISIGENNAPIMEFKDIKEAYNCLKAWQERLFLTDWIINLKLISYQDMLKEYGDNAGTVNFNMVNKSSTIYLTIPDEEVKSRIVKYCAEKTLIHELLHLKYNWVVNENDTIPNLYYDTLEHGLIEQMAKSLIMTKYNLTYSWFINFIEE